MSVTIAKEPPVETQAPAAEAEIRPEGLGLVDMLLRDRPGLLRLIEDERKQLEIAKVMLLTILASAGAFGATLGAYRGGAQILFAAIKLPIAVLLTAALTTPAFAALNFVLRGEATVRRDFSLVLVCLALTSLLLLAAAPLFYLAYSNEVGYHQVFLLAAAIFGGAGLAGLRMFFSGLRARPSQPVWSVALPLFALFAMVGAQMSWTLRPYLVRPRTVNVPFVRAIEGGVPEAIFVSLRSARGIYKVDLSDVRYEEAVPVELPVYEEEVAPAAASEPSEPNRAPIDAPTAQLATQPAAQPPTEPPAAAQPTAAQPTAAQPTTPTPRHELRGVFGEPKDDAALTLPPARFRR